MDISMATSSTTTVPDPNMTECSLAEKAIADLSKTSKTITYQQIIDYLADDIVNSCDATKPNAFFDLKSVWKYKLRKITCCAEIVLVRAEPSWKSIQKKLQEKIKTTKGKGLYTGGTTTASSKNKSKMSASTTRSKMLTDQEKLIFHSTRYSNESWETIHNGVQARVVHKKASLQLITTAVNANTSELQQALNHGEQPASQESDKFESLNQQQKRHIIDDYDDFHNKRFRQDDKDTVGSLLLETNKVIPRVLVESSTPQWSVDYENVFWKNWFDLLESEKGMHVYDLINYGVIECGYKINCRPDFNKALYKELGLVQSSTTIVKENRIYIKRCIKKMKESNGDFLYTINDTSDLPSTPSAKLVSTIFQQFSAHIFSKTEHDIDKYETTYNYRIVWPCIDAVIDSISNKAFKTLPGEINMEAFSSLGSEYKADGLCFFNNKEILVLETSGPYNNDDIPRHAYDHIKGAFGLLAMFRSFINSYHHANLNTLQQLRLWFLHARGDSMHLWALQMPAVNIFILERIAKAKVPVGIKDSYYINSVFELFWILKSGLEETGKTLALLEKSHNDYMEEDLYGDIEENDKREDLRKIVATKVVKPVRGPGYGPLLPKSCDVTFDSISSTHPN